MKLSPRFEIGAGLAGCALLIVSVPAAVLLSLPPASAGATPASVARPHTAVALPPARVDMVIVPGIRLGPDKKMHDAFTPTDFSAKAGQKIALTVYNYDGGDHSITAPELHLNLVIPGAKQDGVPTIMTFTFTITKAGAYHWLCVVPCDDDAKGWAMSHDHYMAGTITITR
jgi:hypothetical protein